MENNTQLKSLRGKLLITGTIKLETGMHIGASNDFCSYRFRRYTIYS